MNTRLLDEYDALCKASRGQQANSGYHGCPCRDCFDVAIGQDEDGQASLCNECKDAGCSRDGDAECQSEHAYGCSCEIC